MNDCETRYAALHAERAALWRIGEQGKLTPEQQARIRDIAEALKHVETERRVQRASEDGTDGWDRTPRAEDRR